MKTSIFGIGLWRVLSTAIIIVLLVLFNINCSSSRLVFVFVNTIAIGLIVWKIFGFFSSIFESNTNKLLDLAIVCLILFCVLGAYSLFFCTKVTKGDLVVAENFLQDLKVLHVYEEDQYIWRFSRQGKVIRKNILIFDRKGVFKVLTECSQLDNLQYSVEIEMGQGGPEELINFWQATKSCQTDAKFFYQKKLKCLLEDYFRDFNYVLAEQFSEFKKQSKKSRQKALKAILIKSLKKPLSLYGLKILNIELLLPKVILSVS